MNNISETVIYLHREKEENHGLADELKMSDRARDQFNYAGQEIEMTVWINKDTGEAWATKINGMPLADKVRI